MKSFPEFIKTQGSYFSGFSYIIPWSEQKTVAVRPLHGPINTDLSEQLIDDIKKNGWTGRDVLLVEGGDYFIALTGSHRLSALAFIWNEDEDTETHPYLEDISYVISGDVEGIGGVLGARDDYERLNELVDLNEKGLVSKTAVELMKQEINENE